MANVVAAKITYDVVVYPLLSLGARLAGVFSRKLRRGLLGRRQVTAHAQEFRKQHPNERIVLFHCASAGEVEGVKPLAAACKVRGFLPCVSYFSPSAEGALKPGEFAFADYSPFDSAFAVRAFYDALRPEVVLISKHDVWPNLVWQANAGKIPIWLINGNFHAGSTKSIPGLMAFQRAVFSQLDGVLTVSKDDAARAIQVTQRPDRTWDVGDSRFDRVLARAQAGHSPLAEFANALKSRSILIGGSTHERDDELLIAALPDLRKLLPELQLLIVPHDPSETVVEQLTAKAQAAGLACGEIAASTLASDVIIVNRSGILADVYQYGILAFVGGGFDRGVHSVLEPMAHGLKVLCGPKIDVSREANEALAEGMLRVACDETELERAAAGFLTSFDKDQVKEFVRTRTGVVNRILDLVLPTDGAART